MGSKKYGISPNSYNKHKIGRKTGFWRKVRAQERLELETEFPRPERKGNKNRKPRTRKGKNRKPYRIEIHWKFFGGEWSTWNRYATKAARAMAMRALVRKGHLDLRIVDDDEE